MLNVDCITASMQVYQNALQVREDSFGGDNVQVALAHEDLAYATYVNEYSSGVLLMIVDNNMFNIFSNQASSVKQDDMQSCHWIS